MRITAQVDREGAAKAEDLGWQVVRAGSTIPLSGWVVAREVPEDATDAEIDEYREALALAISASALGRRGGLKGGRATGASKVRGDSAHYRAMQARRKPKPETR